MAIIAYRFRLPVLRMTRAAADQIAVVRRLMRILIIFIEFGFYLAHFAVAANTGFLIRRDKRFLIDVAGLTILSAEGVGVMRF